MKPKRVIAENDRKNVIRVCSACHLFNRAVAREIDGEYETAISDFTKILENDPENVSSYYHRALLWGWIGKIDHALADLGRAIKIDPALDQAYFNRASVWMQIGRLELALRDINHAIRLAPGKKEYKNMVMALKSRIAAASSSI